MCQIPHLLLPTSAIAHTLSATQTIHPSTVIGGSNPIIIYFQSKDMCQPAAHKSNILTMFIDGRIAMMIIFFHQTISSIFFQILQDMSNFFRNFFLFHCLSLFQKSFHDTLFSIIPYSL